MGPTRDELERAIASFTEAMLVCDPDGRIVGANDRVSDLTGYGHEDLLSKTLDDLADPRDAAPATRLLPAIRGDATLDLETDVRCKDGSTSRLHLRVRSLPVGERPHSLIRLARRRRASDRLAQDPEFIRALLQTPGALLLTVCGEGKVCFASPAFQSLTGLDFRDIRGRHAWDLLADPDQSAALRGMLAAPESSRTLELTWPLAAGATGRSLWTPTRLGGLPVGSSYILLVGQEVPPPRKTTRRATTNGQGRRELERRIGELTAQLEEARSEQDAFTYTLAHDLRAPLRAMSGFSDTLIADYAAQPLDDTGIDYAFRIAKSAQRMDALIEDLLVYNRLRQSTVFLGPTSVAGAVGEVVRRFDRDIRAQQAQVQTDVPALSAVADRPLLLLALSNLLSNALKFVVPGTAPQVVVRAARHDSWIRITVEDRGIGIPPEYADRIFGVFQRLNKTEVYAGTGMGLAIVRRAMDRMNGRVGMESVPGKGSRFWVELMPTDAE